MVRGWSQLYKIRRGCPIASHLLYAYDTLLFLNGSRASLQAVKTFQDLFQEASGEKQSQRVKSKIAIASRQEGKSKHYWIAWKKIARPYEEGGLGIRKLKEVVKAMRLKMVWDVKYGVDSGPWVELIRVKHHANLESNLKGTSSNVSSPLWKKIKEMLPTLEDNIRWLMGQGSKNLWKDNWSGLGLLQQKNQGVDLLPVSKTRDDFPSISRQGSILGKAGTNNGEELRAVYNGLQLSLNKGYSNIKIDSDSKFVVDTLLGKTSCSWHWRH
ncbi:uncharacterized protein LOC131217594 [Magnolia sinica]|uniref:uncharacterized protein LOC131217594 n=1 Tax=Magnolia sinica TaxID=86752 RepID=UPI002658E49B|nr:uncharacterized protein LOC131217594 [Magnolia sinica]